MINNQLIEVVKSLEFFVVENIRTARRFIKKLDHNKNIDKITFFLLNKHNKFDFQSEILKTLTEKKNIGILSENGYPCVADPGSMILKFAHEKNIKVIPLIGPSSIILALSSSGLNGQKFSFFGYLSIDTANRKKEIHLAQKKVIRNDQTQIFIETPFRNQKTFEDLIKNCDENLHLCCAVNLTSKNEIILTKKINHWKKIIFNLPKQPAIFLIGK
tara:strand:+ start:2752 stop:3399 length:648 start_codon:yes stop_codon:yes gene_type:complete